MFAVNRSRFKPQECILQVSDLPQQFIQLLLLHCTYMTYIKTNIHLIFDLDG
jgi:hypothetical protein